ncbi:hypothetical protein AAFN85_20960 [Mucilaginibacter sp. CAU 1740]|uniref:hypothetical protein n=1 Tax=Mucilaginibacter sp. CAU 1740 TaxID=3140365 RepID=UPI00325B9188
MPKSSTLSLKTAITLICACSILSTCKKDKQNPETDPCDSQPVFQWNKTVMITDGREANFHYAVAVDKTGNIYVASEVKGTVDADPGDGVLNLTGPGVVLQKLSSEGKLIWAKEVDKPVFNFDIDGISLVFDYQQNIYLHTEYSTSPYSLGRNVRFNDKGEITNGDDHQYGDFFLAVDKDGNRYDIGFENRLTIMNGNTLLAEKSTVDGGGFYSGIIDLKISPNGNIYLLGRITDKDANFNPTNEAHIKLTEQPTDAKPAIFYLQKLDAKTNFLWVTQVGIGEYAGPLGLLIDNNDNVYVNTFNQDDWRYNTLRKIANTGTLAWKKQVIRNGSMAFDGDNNIYLDGYLQWERYNAMGDLTWSTLADASYNGHLIATGDGKNMYSLFPEPVASSNYTKATIQLRKYTFCGR